MSDVEIEATCTLTRADRRVLDELDEIYGCAYDLAVVRNRWMACGLGTDRWLVASCAQELWRLIAADAAGK